MIRKLSELNNIFLPFALAFIFLYSGLYKILNFNEFIIHFSKISLIHILKIWYLGYLIGPFELYLMVLLFVNKLNAYKYILIVFCVFTAYLINVFWGIGTYTTCACGGIIDQISLPTHIYLNLALIILIYFALNYSISLNTNK